VQCLVSGVRFLLPVITLIVEHIHSPISGAVEKISALRYRHQQITESLTQLEARVADNTAELARMSQAYDKEDEFELPEPAQESAANVTDEDIQRELQEIRELEQKKRGLEERVTGIERDLGGLMR
jgi:chromosome segregation ATPase